MNPGRHTDEFIRKAAFDWLAANSELNGNVFSRNALARGFDFNGDQVRLVGPQGIFKPRKMTLPLSITTSADSPYSDSIDGGNLYYSYRGTNPDHPDNRGLREVMRSGRGLVYFHALMPGRYFAMWPVFVVGDNPKKLTFTILVDDERVMNLTEATGASVADPEAADVRRRYVTAIARRRLHQAAFRERILEAYREQCSLCRLRHLELLDAAHIIGDLEEGGEPVVSNGIALCKLHHAAFDRFFISVRPDYVIEVRRDLLEEVDGPVLKHALQGLHGRTIEVPRRAALKPDRDRLEIRHAKYLEFARARAGS
ncbi:MAG: HNH endonuclease [Steroidobacteraceae bacterium]